LAGGARGNPRPRANPLMLQIAAECLVGDSPDVSDVPSLTPRCGGKIAMKSAGPPKGFGALAGMSLATLAILIAAAVVLCPG